MKVLFITNMPSPYRVDFFNELGKLCDLTVLFERRDASHRNENWFKSEFQNFNGIFLKVKKLTASSVISFEVISYLNRKEYDIIVIGGYSTPTGMLAIQYMNLNRIPFILNADGGLIPKKENIIKRMIKQYYISSAKFCLSTGEETTRYLVHYGANSEKVFIYPFTSLFKKDVIEFPIHHKTKKELKTKLGIKEEKIILSIGQFIHRKGFDILLKACQNIPSQYGVYIIGGEPTEEYIKLKEDLNLINVHFIGFKSKEELKEYYKASDLFVLPTREDIWGLVINEAMAYGLPVITTDRCIAGLELIKDYENGFIVPVNNVEILSDRINEVLDDEIMKEEMSKNNLRKIQKYTIESMAMEHMRIFQEILYRKASE